MLGGALLLCVFEGVARLPIGDYTAITFSSPCVTMLLSTCLLGERCGLYRAGTGLLLVVGVVTVSRPPAIFPHQAAQLEQGAADPTGLACAGAVAVLASLITIITRQTARVHYCVQIFWFAVGAQLVAGVGLATLGSPLAHLYPYHSHLLVIAMLRGP